MEKLRLHAKNEQKIKKNQNFDKIEEILTKLNKLKFFFKRNKWILSY